MVDRAEEGTRRKTEPRRGRLNGRLDIAGQLRTALRFAPRIVLLLTTVWALTGPIDRTTFTAGATGLAPRVVPPDAAVRAGPMFPETGFAVADGPIGNYFTARGGVRTFGPPISNAFPLLGSTVQLFRNHMLKVETNGSVTTVNLFEMNAVPFRSVSGVVIPEVDPFLVASAPIPGMPDYAARALTFIQETAPDQWEGMRVGFYQAFLGTVRAEDALPGGGEVGLLPLFSHEVWGVPVSRPVRDAQDPDSIVQRWERGVMVWNRASASVATVPLGEAFKSLLTGDGLGPERIEASSGSQFLLQYAPNAPSGVARPVELPNTVLAGAFGDVNGGVNAAQLSGPSSAQPTATPTPPVPYPGQAVPQPPPPTAAWPTPPPPPPPGAFPQPGGAGAPAGWPPPGAGAAGQPPAPGMSPPGAAGAGVPPPPGAPLAGTPVAGASFPGAAGADQCYNDEQITYSPVEPRVGGELLVAVTSSRPHPYGRLAGTERTTFVRERPGQLGYVWEWTVALTWPGTHQYTFYVDSTIPCKAIEIAVRQSLATRTPTPTKVPTPWGFDNGNNNNSNNNNSNNSNDNSGADFLNCNSFGSQAQAQFQLRADTSDPNRLDTENNAPRDGVACTGYPYPPNTPTDFNPVPF